MTNMLLVDSVLIFLLILLINLYLHSVRTCYQLYLYCTVIIHKSPVIVCTLVVFVYKIRAFTISLINGAILKKDFNIQVATKLIKIRYFGCHWINKWLHDSSIITNPFIISTFKIDLFVSLFDSLFISKRDSLEKLLTCCFNLMLNSSGGINILFL